MTEKEAIKYLEIMKDCAEDGSVGELQKQMCETAIEALEEIQQYREIGTAEEIREYQKIKRELERYQANIQVSDFLQYFLETIFKGVKHEGFIILTNEDAAAYEQYCQIGTVEECREAVEKLPVAEEAIRKLLCSEYGSSCQFCIHDEDEDAVCCNVGGSESWCCKNAKWNGRLE